jgi:hypothetical protein
LFAELADIITQVNLSSSKVPKKNPFISINYSKYMEGWKLYSFQKIKNYRSTSRVRKYYIKSKTSDWSLLNIARDPREKNARCQPTKKQEKMAAIL